MKLYLARRSEHSHMFMSRNTKNYKETSINRGATITLRIPQTKASILKSQLLKENISGNQNGPHTQLFHSPAPLHHPKDPPRNCNRFVAGLQIRFSAA